MTEDLELGASIQLHGRACLIVKCPPEKRLFLNFKNVDDCMDGWKVRLRDGSLMQRRMDGWMGFWIGGWMSE
jgi:hypothetical protein